MGLELFVLTNLAFLTLDIFLAHSMNGFHHRAEWIPFALSIVAPPALCFGLVAWRARASERIFRSIGMVVGVASVATGIAGMAWHLSSRFLVEMTLDSLVYTAPFAAPLAYAGLGFLLMINRMVPPDAAEWPYWVLLMAEGGFFGNFVFSLADHAQNGFFHATEWIPVFSSALATSFLIVPYLVQVGRTYLLVCGAVLGLQVVVGLLGFWYHVKANLAGPSTSLLDNFIFGAPAMAPLLLPNLVLLAALALVVLSRFVRPPASEELPTSP